MQGPAVNLGLKCEMGVNGAFSRAAAGAAHLHAAARHDRCLGLCTGCRILHNPLPWSLLLGLQGIRPSQPSCTTRARGSRTTSRVSASGPTVCPTRGPTRRWRRLLPLQQCCWCLGRPSQALALVATKTPRSPSRLQPYIPLVVHRLHQRKVLKVQMCRGLATWVSCWVLPLAARYMHNESHHHKQR